MRPGASWWREVARGKFEVNAETRCSRGVGPTSKVFWKKRGSQRSEAVAGADFERGCGRGAPAGASPLPGAIHMEFPGKALLTPWKELRTTEVVAHHPGASFSRDRSAGRHTGVDSWPGCRPICGAASLVSARWCRRRLSKTRSPVMCLSSAAAAAIWSRRCGGMATAYACFRSDWSAVASPGPQATSGSVALSRAQLSMLLKASTGDMWSAAGYLRRRV